MGVSFCVTVSSGLNLYCHVTFHYLASCYLFMSADLYQYYTQANLSKDSGCFSDALIVHCQESDA